MVGKICLCRSSKTVLSCVINVVITFINAEILRWPETQTILCLCRICYSRLTVVLIDILVFYIIVTGLLIAGSKR